jgi:hypothetical protein
VSWLFNVDVEDSDIDVDEQESGCQERTMNESHVTIIKWLLPYILSCTRPFNLKYYNVDACDIYVYKL